jgi:hypothetical protein
MRIWVVVIVALGLVSGLPSPRPVIAADAETAPAPAAAPAPSIAGSRAGDYVGQEVTIEGRVAAIHESPLATVLAFAPNFAGFTATILAADRDKFPSDLEARLRDRLVRVSGTVTAYRGKPEMALRDPSQLVLASPVPGSVAARPAPAAVATPDAAAAAAADDLRRMLTRIEARLDSLDARLRAVEQGEAGEESEPAPARPNRR